MFRTFEIVSPYFEISSSTIGLGPIIDVTHFQLKDIYHWVNAIKNPIIDIIGLLDPPLINF